MAETRQRKFASDIEKVVAEFLNKQVAPLFKSVIISVVGIQISKDLKDSNIYVSIYDLSGKNNNEKIFYTIRDKASQIRNEVAKKCNFKYTPRLNFVYDDGYAYEEKISKTIEELKKKEVSKKSGI